jgi:uncharacterized protein with FMN-binding domain
MRRTPIVVTATAAGLAGVLAFHTRPASLTIGSSSGLPAAASSPAATSAGGKSSGAKSSGAKSAAKKSRHPSSAAGPHAASTTARTAVGPAVNYNYGILSVKVTVSGGRITRVGIASINDGGMYRSQYIDQQSIPILEQQVMQAQSASIQGVSGASYTSAGFVQSLQSALHNLGFQ